MGISGATSVGVGGKHSCAVMGNATVKCWGSNSSGQLGNKDHGPGHHPFSKVPLDVTLPSGALLGSVAEVDGGGVHTCARSIHGSVHCWGLDGSGQLGDDKALANRNFAVPVEGITSARDLGLGYRHSCVVLYDATGRCWGANDEFQLATLITEFFGYSAIAVQTQALSGAGQVDGGWNHGCAARGDSNQAMCWGLNDRGQLGNGSTHNGPTAAPTIAL
ncbi:MAG: RCC1 domain-containing protein [Microthrixaceae bacterium]